MIADWLYTLRWKNLLIIWISILVIILPHLNSPMANCSHYFEFILWGIVCSSVAAIGNITNDLWDVKQDKENKKKNIFVVGKNKRLAYFIIAVLLLCAVCACLVSKFVNCFLVLTIISLFLLLLYNLFLKRIAFLGNLVVAFLTALIFIGINFIITTNIIYFKYGFNNKYIELLACFAFITTFVREILKDAEDRTGDSFAGFKTIAQYLSDKWLAMLIIFISILGCAVTYFIIGSRHVNFTVPCFYFSCLTVLISIVAAIIMFISHPSKYIRATRIVKAGMLGCLVIYLLLSL